jgi:hypothetical protein
LQVLHDIAPDHVFGGVVIVQQLLRGPSMTTAALVNTLDPLLYRKRSGEVPSQGVVILSPPASKKGVVGNLLVFAATQRAAGQISRDALDRIIAASSD